MVLRFVQALPCWLFSFVLSSVLRLHLSLSLFFFFPSFLAGRLTGEEKGVPQFDSQ